jgi:hypothetical protein
MNRDDDNQRAVVDETWAFRDVLCCSAATESSNQCDSGRWDKYV